MSGEVHMACNFDHLNQNERLLKVTGSHVHYRNGIISETMQDRDAVTSDIPVTIIEINN